MGKSMRLTAYGVLILLLSPTYAAELSPFSRAQRIGVVVSKMRLPPTLRKDLVSGLTNRILVKIDLVQNDRSLSRQVVEMTIRYDLWEETFGVDTRIDNDVVSVKTYRELEEVISALSNLKLPASFVPPLGAPRSQLMFTAEILFNPVDKERMDEIRKWVAENSAPALPDPTAVRPGLSSNSPASESRALFNKIFEQYAAGASVAAAWRDSGSSKRFHLNELSADSSP